MKQNSSTVSGAGHIDAADAEVLAALTASGGDTDAPAAVRRGFVQRVSSLTGAAVLAIAAAVIAVGLAGGAASSAAASIPESEPLASGDTETAASDPLPAEAAAGAELESGPIRDGRWEYALGPVQWAQRDTVLAANVTPPPQPAGYGWALMELSVLNTGSEPATPGRFEVVLHTGGWTVSHLDIGRQPIRMPAEYTPHLLQPGEQVTGNLGFWLPDHATDSADCVIELRVVSTTDASYTSHWLACG